MLCDCLYRGKVLACVAGVDYLARIVANELLFVEFMENDSSLNKENYDRHT